MEIDFTHLQSYMESIPHLFAKACKSLTVAKYILGLVTKQIHCILAGEGCERNLLKGQSLKTLIKLGNVL